MAHRLSPSRLWCRMRARTRYPSRTDLAPRSSATPRTHFVSSQRLPGGAPPTPSSSVRATRHPMRRYGTAHGRQSIAQLTTAVATLTRLTWWRVPTPSGSHRVRSARSPVTSLSPVLLPRRPRRHRSHECSPTRAIPIAKLLVQRALRCPSSPSAAECARVAGSRVWLLHGRATASLATSTTMRTALPAGARCSA